MEEPLLQAIEALNTRLNEHFSRVDTKLDALTEAVRRLGQSDQPPPDTAGTPDG